MTDTTRKSCHDPWPGDVDAPAFRPNPAHARKAIPDEVLSDAKNLFETTDLPKSEISRRVGLHRSLLHRTIERKGWRRPLKAKRREILARRLRARIETELAAAEIGLRRAAPARDGEEARRFAATLASLMRTLREMQRYDRDEAASSPRVAEPEAEQDPDALRDALADRLARFRRQAREGW